MEVGRRRCAHCSSFGRSASVVQRRWQSGSSFLPRDVVIASAARTPVGSFLGSLASLTAPQLGGIAISQALKRIPLEGDQVDGVIMGQVLPAGCGQAPARQAALNARIPERVDAFGVNKVCSSGLKSVALAANAVALGQADIMVAGGMESMSNAPYLLRKARVGGYKHGHGVLEDNLLQDGLWDVYNDIHMGKDEYALASYKRAADAWKTGMMTKEVVPVKISNPAADKKPGSGAPPFVSVEEDEEYPKLKLDKVAGLKPVFDPEGTITAANASKLNDGAAAVVLMSADTAERMAVEPLARILSFADAAVEPIDFSIAPSQSVQKAIKLAGLHKVDYYEINEAFSCVVLANMQLLGLDHEQVNVHGGAVALGHPIGASGCRILISLLNVLGARDATYGCAAICNGGGGSTAMVVERIAA